MLQLNVLLPTLENLHKTYLNTSYVTVKLKQRLKEYGAVFNLNTSYVTVKQI